MESSEREQMGKMVYRSVADLFLHAAHRGARWCRLQQTRDRELHEKVTGMINALIKTMKGEKASAKEKMAQCKKNLGGN